MGALAENVKEIRGYANRTKGGVKAAVRGAQIMSIFGVAGERSDFFSESFPVLTVRQSEHGWLPSSACMIAARNGARFEQSMIIVVHANDCKAIQWSPIAQQSATIVATRPTQRNTIPRLVSEMRNVNHGRGAALRCPGQRCALSLPFRNENSIAVVEINRRTDVRDLKRLSPASRVEFFSRFDGFCFWLRGVPVDVNHRFGQNSAIHLL